MKQFFRKNRIAILCAFAVMAAAVIVRLPAAQLSVMPEEQRAAYMTESGVPYLTDPDSYFHARITDTALLHGSSGNKKTEDSTLWDKQSNYPEGRNAGAYQTGIIRAAGIIWKTAGFLFHMDLYAVEFWLPAVFAAFAALAAFILGRRVSGTAGGLTAGILVSCASAFVARVLPGRFDTDMFTAVMDVLLILTMTEALRAGTIRKRLAASAGFALSVALYSWCWSVYAFMFSILTAAGGAVFLTVSCVLKNDKKRTAADAGLRIKPEMQAWLFCMVFMTAGMLLTGGFSFFRQWIRSIKWAGSMTESGIMPNLLGSVTELDRPAFASSNPAEWFVSYVPGKTLTILNGIGGAAVAILCTGGILMLILRLFRQSAAEEEVSAASSKKNELLYLCVLGTWLAGSLYASEQGIRFVEHLAVPVGILAGLCTGWITPKPGNEIRLIKVGKVCAAGLICAAAIALPVSGALQISRQNRPSVSDALAEGMEWIHDHAEDPEAVIASWWDLGYFYEYASGHPAIWDGGSQSGVKAILMARALTDTDLQMSERILQMLAAEGGRTVNRLTGYLSEERAFDAIWETLPMEREETALFLQEEYGIAQKDAEEISGMIHPQQKKEIYLVISGDMLYKLGWIEYYADWDFSGNNTPPAATVYSVMPDGSANMNSDKEEARAFFAARAQETIWKLFFKADGDPYFTPVLETNDGVNQMQVWRVE